jgi:hypothetical protein
VQDKHRDILLAAEAVDGGRSSVAAGSPDDSQMMPVSALLALVSSHEKVFKEIAEELQRTVLEGVTRAMEQFEEVEVVF